MRTITTKAALFVALCMACIPNALGQGTVQLNNRITGVVDAKITMQDGVTGVDQSFTAQLTLLNSDSSITPLHPITTFHPNGPGYVTGVTARDVQVPGIGGNQPATLVLRAFLGADWDSATVRGESEPVTVTLGGNWAGPPMVPSTLRGLQGFSVTELQEGYVWSSTRGVSMVIAPEPSTYALALLGGAALLFRVRSRGK